jgi:replicative DNA helicase
VTQGPARDEALFEGLPINLEAERAVLGAVLLDNNAIDIATPLVRKEDFFLDNHKRIWAEMQELAEKHKPIDLVTMTEGLHHAGELEAAGGAAYLAQLVDGVPEVSNVEEYARIVREKSVLRQLVHTGNFLQQQAAHSTDDMPQVLERCEAAVLAIGDRKVGSDLLSMRAVVQENAAAIEKSWAEGVSRGLATGYTSLDTITGGLFRGDVTVLAARPSIGKTALALNIAEKVAIAGAPVALFSLEMSRTEILMRLVSSLGEINLQHLRTGRMSAAAQRQAMRWMLEAAKLAIHVEDANPTTVQEIGAKARRMKRATGLGLVIIDYLQLVTASHAKFSNRNEEVGATSRAIKALARSLDVPVIVLSQLTRASEKEERRPQLSDLRESGAIEQDADVVLFIHRPKAFAVDAPAIERNSGQLIVAKQRNGPTEAVPFVFLSNCVRFCEAMPQ